MAARLDNLPIGTRDYLDLRSKVDEREANLRMRITLETAEFLQRESAAYGAIYQEIVREVADYAAQNGIEIVLRVNTAPAEPKTPQQIVENMKRQVVWFADSRDITQIILDRLNKKGVAPKTRPAKPAKEGPPSHEPGGPRGHGKKAP